MGLLTQIGGTSRHKPGDYAYSNIPDTPNQSTVQLDYDMKREKQTHNSCFPQIRMCLWCWSHIWCKWCIMSRTEIQHDQHRAGCTEVQLQKVALAPRKPTSPYPWGWKSVLGRFPLSHPVGLLWGHWQNQQHTKHSCFTVSPSNAAHLGYRTRNRQDISSRRSVSWRKVHYNHSMDVTGDCCTLKCMEYERTQSYQSHQSHQTLEGGDCLFSTSLP